MVSQPPRLADLAAALKDFCLQTYPHKELIVVVDDSNYSRAVQKLVEDAEGAISVVALPTRVPLGALRNLALNYARGEMICQWDDDDRYSPERLSLQVAALVDPKVRACFLHQQLHYFQTTREIFWTDWRLFAGARLLPAPSSWIPGTVLFRRGPMRYPETGALSARGEDTAFAFELWRAGAAAIEAPPGTYLRRFHGDNTWNREHHRSLAMLHSQTANAMLESQTELEKATRWFGLGSPIYFMAGSELVFCI